MPTEPQYESSTTDGDATPRAGAARPSLAQRLERAVTGRMLLAAARLGVAFAFVAAGYVGAAAVHSGVRQASAPGQHQILAASAAQK